MEFNVSKCKIPQVLNVQEVFSHIVAMKLRVAIPLESVEEHSHLGVANRMSWKPHINNVCNKANRLLGFLRRNLHHCSPNLKETAYKHLILATKSWILCLYNLIYQLEMIQTGQHVLY